MAAKKPRTRAHYLGVSPARMLRASTKRIDAVRLRVQEIAYSWGDIDNSVVNEADRVCEALDAFEETVKEAVEYLKAPEDGGQE